MTTLHCDHRMNLPCDVFTVLMVVTCVLIYVFSYNYIADIHTYKLLQPSKCIFYITLILLKCTIHTCRGVACAVNLSYNMCNPNAIA